MTELQISLPRVIGARRALLVGAALMTGIVLWAAAYGAGLCPWLGYTSQSLRSINIGGRLPVAQMGTGRVRLGFGTFVFFAGQTIVLSYDAQIDDGCMSMHVWRMLGGFIVPVLIGNVIGGTALFALISYAQVKDEI